MNLKKKAIFKILHPDSDPLFVFDNPSNHHEFAPDALVAARLNRSDGGKNLETIMREGRFEDKKDLPLDSLFELFRRAKKS